MKYLTWLINVKRLHWRKLSWSFAPYRVNITLTLSPRQQTKKCTLRLIVPMKCWVISENARCMIFEARMDSSYWSVHTPWAITRVWTHLPSCSAWARMMDCMGKRWVPTCKSLCRVHSVVIKFHLAWISKKSALIAKVLVHSTTPRLTSVGTVMDKV